MTVRFLEAARNELREAVQYYDARRDGLGQEFLEEIRTTVRKIEQSPDTWSPLSENTRRCRTKRFPYGVIYRVDGDEIVIVAVAHLHRRPGYWSGRDLEK